MYNIFRLYNQNKRKFWVTIIAIIISLLVIWRFLFLFSNNNNSNKENLTNISQDYNLNSISLSSQKSATTGKKTSISKEKISIIDEFVTYCNSGKIQEAYNLVSNECKEEMYQNINIFNEMYYNPIFSKGKKNAKIENWHDDIYIIDFVDDYLATGRFDDSNNIRDYITIIIDSENNYKLNINKYIGRKELNNTGKSAYLEIKAIRKDIYMDYEKYLFEVKNEANHQVCIGTVEDENNISYLIDKNNIKYNAIASDLSNTDLILYEKQTKTLQIKYYNQYSSTRKIQRVDFPRIYLNYQSYLNYNNKNNYTEYGNIQINI